MIVIGSNAVPGVRSNSGLCSSSTDTIHRFSPSSLGIIVPIGALVVTIIAAAEFSEFIYLIEIVVVTEVVQFFVTVIIIAITIAIIDITSGFRVEFTVEGAITLVLVVAVVDFVRVRSLHFFLLR